MASPARDSSRRHRVVIVGGGFGGLSAARALRDDAVLTWAITVSRDARKERILTIRQIESLRDLCAVPAAPERPPVAS
jgi:cation diffusion facilitator CzcD-associated flavoprotein CzcO